MAELETQLVFSLLDELPPDWQRFFSSQGLQFQPLSSQSFSLYRQDEGWALKDPEELNLKIDFVNDHLTYKKSFTSKKNELIARALGLTDLSCRVLDLSAGLAQDAVFISQLGGEVLALERNPILYFLLEQARQLSEEELKKQLQFAFSEAIDYLQNKDLKNFDVIYFDPMFPEKKKKSALPRKEMQIFKKIVGDDSDAGLVLQAALDSLVPRVVVKRPVHADPVALPTQIRPSYSLEGKLIRFDIYKKKAPREEK